MSQTESIMEEIYFHLVEEFRMLCLPHGFLEQLDVDSYPSRVHPEVPVFTFEE